jgi:hypothetical protein
VLHDLFGGPSDIARAHSLTHAAYTILLSWIRVGEAMMRRRIAIEAAAFPKPNTRPLLRASRKRARRMMEFWPEKPDEWRVSGASASAAAAHRVSARAPRKPPQRVPGSPIFHSAWPLAERYEALIRVFNNPLPAARRLAARLHARPHTLAAVLAAPAEYEHRVDHADEFTTQAKQAWPQRRDSS